MDTDVFQIPGKTWWVRYSDAHGWGCPTGDGPLWFQERAIYMPLLPLLELSYMNARELVDVGAKAAHLSQAVADDFPFKELVAYALAWETDYWPDNAIKWLEQGFPMNWEIAEGLKRLSNNPRSGQRLRHSASALARRWGREDV